MLSSCEHDPSGWSFRQEHGGISRRATEELLDAQPLRSSRGQVSRETLGPRRNSARTIAEKNNISSCSSYARDECLLGGGGENPNDPVQVINTGELDADTALLCTQGDLHTGVQPIG